MTPPKILARMPNENTAAVTVQATTSPSISTAVPYNSGAVGSAHVQLFLSNDHEDRGGYVLRITINDSGSSFAPLARDLPNGVDLHLAGEAEGAALLAALAGLLASFHAVGPRQDVGV